MPPKGTKKVKADTSARPPATPQRSKDLMIELAGGEKDAQNLSFHTQLLEAMEVISDKFPGIVEKSPLTIAEGGIASAFQADEPRAGFADTRGVVHMRHQPGVAEPHIFSDARGPCAQVCG